MTQSISDKGEFARELNLPPIDEFGSNYLPENVHLHLHFAPHNKAEQLDAFAELLPPADIVIPEVPNWDEKVLKGFSAISKGDRKQFERMTSDQFRGGAEWRVQLLKLIKGTYKSIALVDANQSQKHLLLHTNEALQKPLGVGKDVDETLHLTADALSFIGSFCGLRDRIMLANLGPKITDIVQNHPRLREKESVLGLGVFGFIHTPIYSALTNDKDTQEKVTGSSWSAISPLDPDTDALRVYAEGGVPTRQQLLRCLAARVLKKVEHPLVPGIKVYESYMLYSRKPERVLLVAMKLIEILTDENSDNPERVLSILKYPNRTDHNNFIEDQIKDIVDEMRGVK